MHAAIGPFNKSDYVIRLAKVGPKAAFPDMKFTVWLLISAHHFA